MPDEMKRPQTRSDRTSQEPSQGMDNEGIKALFFRVVPEGTAKSTVNSLRPPIVSYFTIAIPNTCEISAIEQWIPPEGHNFHRLTAEAQSATTVLQERRGARISTAVSCKINVRGLVESLLLEAA